MRRNGRASIVVLTLLSALLALPVALFAQSGSCHPGVYQLARGDYAAALKSLTAATAQGSSDAGLLNNRGIAELLAGDLKAARKSFATALAQDPALADARFNLGIVDLRESNFAAAAEAFAAVWKIENSPLRARAAYHHALADDRLNRLDDATVWLTRALDDDPTLQEAKLYLGVVLERKGEFAEAGKYYKDFLTDQPKSVIAMLRFGVVAIRAGYPDTARRYLRLVVQQSPDSPEGVEARKYLFTLE